MDATVDPMRLNIFVHHSVSAIGRVFQVKFARVATVDGEFTSAVSAPSVPAEYAPAILGVLGLQPHHRFHKHYTLVGPAGSTSVAPPDLRVAYNVPSNLTGLGQAIAVIMQGPSPLSADVGTFWTDCTVPQTAANYTTININSGDTVATDNDDEGCIDVEWSSGMAPGAAVRFYNIPELDDFDAVAALTQVATDRLTVPGLNVVTMRFGGSENGTFADENLDFHNVFATLSNSGVTLFASSGDGGSNPDDSGATNGYGVGANYPLNVEYPASDTYVTAVGGTDLKLNTNGTINTETGWFLDSTNGTGTAASGGGISVVYSRPSWQEGAGLLASSGTARLVPDVAADAWTVKGSSQSMFVVHESGGHQAHGGFGGTSCSSPIWAGICACLNQARATAGQPPLGLLGPKIYPLLGTSSFQDITTSGTLGNGAYQAGTGYDYLTGLGSPNVANLSTALTTVNTSLNSDFNGDGKADILWQNTATGARGMYLMNGTSVTTWSDLGTISTAWQIAGTGDFLQNGNTDIVWQNMTTGDRGIYLMNGTAISGWQDIGTLPIQWKIAGVGDFNGDGYPDILWQNTTTGECGFYLMNGTSVSSWAELGTLPPAWRIAAVGDFNGDGKPDILWQNSLTGECGFYIMNGTTVSGWVELGTLPLEWQVAAAADYNGDGKTDILWQNTVTGDRGFYLMNGTTVVSWVDLGTLPVQWQIAP
jgi:kumamolisin